MKRIYFQKNETDDRNLIPLSFIEAFTDESLNESDLTWKLLYDADIYDIMVKNNDGPFVSYHNIGSIAINTMNKEQLFYIFQIKDEFKQISSIYTKVMQLIYSMALPTHSESILTMIPYNWSAIYNTAFKNNNYTVKTDEENKIITAQVQIDLTAAEI